MEDFGKPSFVLISHFLGRKRGVVMSEAVSRTYIPQLHQAYLLFAQVAWLVVLTLWLVELGIEGVDKIVDKQ